MKTIRVNGIEQAAPASVTNFEELVTALNQSFSGEQKVISAIRMNGRELTEVDEKELHSKSFQQLGELEFDTSSPVELALETLGTLDAYVDRLLTSIGRAAEHYKGKNLITADAHFAKALDGMDLFVQTIGGIKLALRVGLNPKVALAEATLVSVMNDLLEAKRQNNYVFLAELLEKDLIECLTEWKEMVFPAFRGLRTS